MSDALTKKATAEALAAAQRRARRAGLRVA